MFDNKKYWENRKNGLRGQENLSQEPKVVRESGVEMQMTRKGLIAMPRYKRRHKLVDRHQTKKGFVYGVKIGSKVHEKLESAKRKFAKLHKGERIISEEQRRHLENNPLTIDPAKSNHERHLERRKAREDARTK